MARSKSSSGPQTPPAKSDAYVGLLAISLAAQVTGAIFFYLDWSSYPTAKPNPPAAITIPAAAAPVPVPAPTPAPAPGAAMMGGAPPMAGGAPPMP